MTRSRQKTVSLPESVGETGRQQLQEALRSLAAVEAVEAVEAIEMDARRCRLTYSFPDITFAAIWSRLQDAVGEPLPLLSRIRYSLAAVMEDNERDYLLHPCGWHRYVETVHARRFDPLHAGSSDARKQQWQRYTGDRPGTTG